MSGVQSNVQIVLRDGSIHAADLDDWKWWQDGENEILKWRMWHYRLEDATTAEREDLGFRMIVRPSTEWIQPNREVRRSMNRKRRKGKR